MRTSRPGGVPSRTRRDEESRRLLSPPDEPAAIQEKWVTLPAIRCQRAGAASNLRSRKTSDPSPGRIWRNARGSIRAVIAVLRVSCLDPWTPTDIRSWTRPSTGLRCPVGPRRNGAAGSPRLGCGRQAALSIISAGPRRLLGDPAIRGAATGPPLCSATSAPVSRSGVTDTSPYRAAGRNQDTTGLHGDYLGRCGNG